VLASPVIQSGVFSLPDNSFAMNLSSLIPGQNYVLQSTTNLATGIWTTETNFVATQTAVTFTKPAAGAAQEFFRLVAY
jgi:hypothetical protein